MRPNLQLALDLVDLNKAERIAAAVHPWVNWLEVGTPLILSEGMEAVRRLRSGFPSATLVADVKIVDAASLIVPMVLESGSDVITVLSGASDQTLMTCVDLAHKKKCKVLGDHIAASVSLDICSRLTDLGVGYLGIHLPKDSISKRSVGALEDLFGKITLPVVLAGGIDLEFLGSVRGLPVFTFIVGSAIINQADPASSARSFAEALDGWSGDSFSAGQGMNL